MPCEVYTKDEIFEHSVQKNKEQSKIISELKEEVNQLTQLLCTVCRFDPHFLDYQNDRYVAMLKSDVNEFIPPIFFELNEWWKSHKQDDEIRRNNANIDYYKAKHPKLTNDEIIRLVDIGVLQDVDCDVNVIETLQKYGYID